MSATENPTSGKIVNVAAYKFVRLEELPTLREELKAQCAELGLKGTILLSPEGINVFAAAERPVIDRFLRYLRGFEAFADLVVKESFNDYQPFKRMLVKLKKEIIAFGVDGIDPEQKSSPKLSPQELKQWLDEGKPVTLLDTRNTYEVEVGTFKEALLLDLDHFRNFPQKVEELPEELKEQPVVMFCTGGIRCEKAGPFMQDAGFQQVFQLDGGILRYFEECGGDHWEGDCFVFDQRIALDPDLKEASDKYYVEGETFAGRRCVSRSDATPE